VNTVAKPYLAFQVGSNSALASLGAGGGYTPQINPQATGSEGAGITPYPDNACVSDNVRFKAVGCH
jgi:hypothetical protein